jgi:hypothetical protein
MKKSLSTKLSTEERRTVGKMNGTAITNRLQNSFKITCTDHRIIEILGLRPSNGLSVSCYYIKTHSSSRNYLRNIFNFITSYTI